MIRLQDVGKKWKAISSVGAVVIATTTAFFRPPPVGESSAFIAVGGFLATVCAGLIYVAMVRWSTAKHAAWWVVAGAVGAVAAVASFYVYESQWDAHVATYQGQAQIVGEVLTPEGAAWVKQRGQADASQLLFDAAGEAEQIWTAESIARVKSRMRLTYLAGFPLVAVGILSTLQAMHCVLQKKPRKRRAPKPAAVRT